MAIAAATVFEVRTGGSDNNGGGFVTGASGTDFSQQNAAQFALTTVSSAGAGAVNLDAASAANMVGNICQVISGTNFTPGLYQIISVVVGVSFTADRNTTTGVGASGVINIGGAFASPGKAVPAASVDGNMIWIKAGTYTQITATPGAGGPVVYGGNIRLKVEGYSATRGDRAGRPLLSAGSTTSNTMVTLVTNDVQQFIHFSVDGNSQSGVSGISGGNSGTNRVIDCVVQNCNQASQTGISGALIVASSKVSNCTTGILLNGTGALAIFCHADACGVGISQTTNVNHVMGCVATDCSDDGFSSTIGGTVSNCTAEGNTGDGFSTSSSSNYINCASTNNGGYGYNTAAISALQHCASYNNTSGRTNTAPMMDAGSVLVLGDPWVDASTDDVRPDNTTNEGALLRATALGVFGQVATRDIGAVQHSDPTAGGGSVFGGHGGVIT